MFLFKKNQNIGAYTVVFPHKESSYAETYRVKDAEGKVKFLKLIFMEYLKVHQYDADGQVIECEISKMLNHPNLCTFVDSGSLEYEGHQLLYIVTEYERGETLDEYLNRNESLSMQQIVQVVSGTLSALEYLHTLQRPIVHNEVTLENIFLNLVGDCNNIKLIDFGASRFADLEPNPKSWQFQNLYYVPNERFFGKDCIQSDLFSVGVILYRLVFGIMPWETRIAGLTTQQQVQIILEKRATRLTAPNIDNLNVDEKIIKCIIKALTPNLEDRFASAKEFREALNGDIEIEMPHSSMKEENESKASNDIKPKKGNGFKDVAGMEELKNMLSKKIINVLKNPERAERYKIQIPNGMLLYGPPGCGKSFIAEKFAEEAGYNYMFVKSSDLASIYVHGSQEKIGKLFDEARKKAPTILNFDEFEALVPNRSKINNSSESGEVNEFLSQMNNCGKDRIFIIASSNRPDLIDPAIRRKGRIDQLIYVPAPDKEARIGMFKMHMQGRPAEEIDYTKLAEMTENFVASDIAYIVNDAALRASEDDQDITQSLLEEVIKENKPSVSLEDAKFYEDIKAKMMNEDKKNERTKIGFV